MAKTCDNCANHMTIEEHQAGPNRGTDYPCASCKRSPSMDDNWEPISEKVG